MATPTGRIRKGPGRFQGVSMQDNWRTDWFKTEETAQKHLDEHLEELSGKKTTAKKAKQEPTTVDNLTSVSLPPHEPGDSISVPRPPGGFNTGPRGGDASEPVPPGGQNTGPRGE